MLSDLPLYEGKFAIRINEPHEPLYYFFDYDERSYSVNMDFQHFHSFYEIFILLDDEASHILQGKLYPLQMYDIVLLHPALLHKTYYPVGKPKKRLIVNFSLPAELLQYFPEVEKLLDLFYEPLPIYRFDAACRQQLFGCLNRIFSVNKQTGSMNRIRTHQLFLELLTILYQNRRGNLYCVEAEQGSLSEKIYEICACIHANYQEALTLDSMAQRFHISPYYLSHQFKLVTHFGLNEYIQRTRVRIAQQALIFTEKKITVVAEECGIRSFSQFNRVFKKICGVSPSQYRKENKLLKAQPM